MTEQIDAPTAHLSFLAPRPGLRTAATPTPDATWELPGGTAWVFYAKGNPALTRPVILSDGFATGATTLDEAWAHLERPETEGGFPFATALRDGGRDLIILGYDERSAAIQINAETAMAAIRRANEESRGISPLVVGGFSMGGLVTRYALALMERRNEEHNTAVHLSVDSPHRGAWIPIGLQAFAHFLAQVNPGWDMLSRQINSDAARQLLWRHIDTATTTPREDPLRLDFLEDLDSVGSWPRQPRLLGVASGAGNGVGNGIRPGIATLKVDDGYLAGTVIRAQATGDHKLVAQLRSEMKDLSIDVHTSGLPELDGAPGGTLGSFGIAVLLLEMSEHSAFAPYRDVCFVPTVSAVAIRDLEDAHIPVDSLTVHDGDLDDFFVAHTNQAHSAITPDIAKWILARLPG